MSIAADGIHMTQTGPLQVLWRHSSGPSWPTLTESVEANVVIIGAGITGLTAAWHLVSMGLRVVVLEAGTVGGGTTGSSTGNLYATTGPGLHAIEAKHGLEVAQTVVAARSSAIDFIDARVAELNIDCGFRRVPWHLFSAPDAEGATKVRDEFAAAARAGLPASDYLPAEFPFRATALTTVAAQAQFDPQKYVEGLAAALGALDGRCRIFENSAVLKAEDGTPCAVQTAAGRVSAGHIIKATHTPQGVYAVHAAMTPQREYAVVARVHGELPADGIYWNASPAWSYSVRPLVRPEGNFVMVLGESHKPGEQNEQHLANMAAFLHGHFQVAEFTCTWAAQNYRSADHLPYIGTPALEPHTWIATGFAADGLVWGTLAGKLISDEIGGIAHPWADTFDPKRFTPLASAKNFLKENVAVSGYLLKDRLFYDRSSDCEDVAPGEGRTLSIDGEKVAVSRDAGGQLLVVSSVCPHMGCIVHWNGIEKSWDCPCHGSRFAPDGTLIEGPAQHGLAVSQTVDPPAAD